MVIADQITKSFLNKQDNSEIRAIHKLSFHIKEGSITGLIGKSGAGKTTLLKMISGLLEPSVGCIHTFGRRPTMFENKERKHISVLFSNVSLLDGERTVLENFQLLQIMYKNSKEDYFNEMKYLCTKMRVWQYLHEKVSDLSLGQRMRIEFLAAVIGKPKLLILDEPTVGLDSEAKEIFKEMIMDFSKNGMTIIISSHNMVEISTLCSKILFIDKGELIFSGTKYQLRKNYGSINSMSFVYKGKIPNIDDLPIIKYSVESQTINIRYDNNLVRSAEILQYFIREEIETDIIEVSILEPRLEEIVKKVIGDK